MKLYIAAPWVDKDLIPDIAAKFEVEGHTITWKWWETEDLGPTAEGKNMDSLLMEQAYNDFEGVRNCDTLVLINTYKSEGKAVEQGVALALGIPIIAIGKLGDGTSMNVFHYLPNYIWVNTVEEAICQLT